MMHDNIVRLQTYAETPAEYQLYIDYADKGDYLCSKILKVRSILSNLFKIKIQEQI